MPREFSLIAPRQVALQTYTDAPVKPDEVRGHAILSGISHGTEMNLYRGDSPFADKEFNTDLRLFLPQRAAAAGEIWAMSGWDGSPRSARMCSISSRATWCTCSSRTETADLRPRELPVPRPDRGAAG